MQLKFRRVQRGVLASSIRSDRTLLQLWLHPMVIGVDGPAIRFVGSEEASSTKTSKTSLNEYGMFYGHCEGQVIAWLYHTTPHTRSGTR